MTGETVAGGTGGSRRARQDHEAEFLRIGAVSDGVFAIALTRLRS